MFPMDERGDIAWSPCRPSLRVRPLLFHPTRTAYDVDLRPTPVSNEYETDPLLDHHPILLH